MSSWLLGQGRCRTSSILSLISKLSMLVYLVSCQELKAKRPSPIYST
jgi:hypothetical protein